MIWRLESYKLDEMLFYPFWDDGNMQPEVSCAEMFIRQFNVICNEVDNSSLINLKMNNYMSIQKTIQRSSISNLANFKDNVIADDLSCNNTKSGIENIIKPLRDDVFTKLFLYRIGLETVSTLTVITISILLLWIL
jgi:hypothetical protein